MDAILKVFGLSLLAGLGTGLGGLLAVVRKPGQRTAGLLMGLTAGVMITLSFLELVNEAWQASGYLVTASGFAAGAFLMFLVDSLTPHIRFGEEERKASNARLLRTGLLVAIGISIHNLPEGIAVGAGYMHLPEFGMFIALAIALHNIPEGMATALPLCEGGHVQVAGFPDRFSLRLDELVPAAREFGHLHFTTLGIILGGGVRVPALGRPGCLVGCLELEPICSTSILGAILYKLHSARPVCSSHRKEVTP